MGNSHELAEQRQFHDVLTRQEKLYLLAEYVTGAALVHHAAPHSQDRSPGLVSLLDGDHSEATFRVAAEAWAKEHLHSKEVNPSKAEEIRQKEGLSSQE